MEEWRDIPGWEGLYQGSTEGIIKSVERFIIDKIGRKTFLKSKVIKPHISCNYLRLTFQRGNEKKSYFVHDLIAITFPEICGEHFEGADCNHLNEITTDNRAINLRWCTRKENNSWGTRKERISEKLTNGKLSKPVVQYTLEGEFVAEYPSQGEAERQTGCSKGNISNCCCGRYKQSYGYIWKYKTLPN